MHVNTIQYDETLVSCDHNLTLKRFVWAWQTKKKPLKLRTKIQNLLVIFLHEPLDINLMCCPLTAISVSKTCKSWQHHRKSVDLVWCYRRCFGILASLSAYINCYDSSLHLACFLPPPPHTQTHPLLGKGAVAPQTLTKVGTRRVEGLQPLASLF